MTKLKLTTISLCVASALCAQNLPPENHYEITVTANKMSEKLHEVPQSITVIDEETIEEKGIKDISGIMEQIPNLTGFVFHGIGANFRGLNGSSFTENNPIVVYIDGIPSTNKYSFDVALANAKRVEVLRGPQGAMYGKDAIGAVINIVTKNPRDIVSGSVGLEYSSHNTFTGKFNISAPIIEEKLYFGINAEGTKSDGWIENTYKDDNKADAHHNAKVGAYLLAHINDRLKIRLNASFGDDKKDKIFHYGYQGNINIDDIKRKDAEKHAWDYDESEKIKSNSQALNISYDFDDYRLSSTTTHKQTKSDATYDADFGTQDVYKGLYHGSDQENQEFTQELRMSNKDDKIKWVGGLYFDKSKVKWTPQFMQMPIPLDPANPGVLTNSMIAGYSKQDYKSAAIFGQVKFPIVSKLDLTLGGRFQKIKKTSDNDFYFYPVNSPKPSSPMHHLELEKTWNAFLPKLALSYKINDNLMPYFSVSKGYMPGGFNQFPDQGGAKENTFEPQISTNYELGLKGAYQNFSFTASVFKMFIKDIHIYKVVNGSWQTDNAKKAHSQGAEFNFNYLPTNEFEISGAFGLIDAKYDDYDIGTKKLDGENIEVTPKFSANLGLAYYHKSGVYGRVDARALGKTSYYNSGMQKMEKIGNAYFADVKLGYRVGDFDIYGFVKNISNTKRISSYQNTGEVVLANFNEPRTFGLGVKYEF